MQRTHLEAVAVAAAVAVAVVKIAAQQIFDVTMNIVLYSNDCKDSQRNTKGVW